jgi:mannose-6-phosphate isomerase-like protein (cupin superfamily)
MTDTDLSTDRDTHRGTDNRPSTSAPINLGSSAAGLAETWSARVAGAVNDVLVKVARIEGDFIWHNHPDTDEGFLLLSGDLVIDMREDDGTEHPVTLAPSDFFVVPRGVFHRPRSAGGATITLFEAAGTVNTGTEGGALTVPVDVPLA